MRLIAVAVAVIRSITNQNIPHIYEWANKSSQSDSEIDRKNSKDMGGKQEHLFQLVTRVKTNVFSDQIKSRFLHIIK